jgi:hypothetical protein
MCVSVMCNIHLVLTCCTVQEGTKPIDCQNRTGDSTTTGIRGLTVRTVLVPGYNNNNWYLVRILVLYQVASYDAVVSFAPAPCLAWPASRTIVQYQQVLVLVLPTTVLVLPAAAVKLPGTHSTNEYYY